MIPDSKEYDVPLDTPINKVSEEQYFYRLKLAIQDKESKEWSKQVAKDVMEIFIEENKLLVD
ncbi:MAG: hypothetical protein EOM90_01810 [Alphaproteobacteria bacterium]|nr:hypothetical protein [Alphaproteobacteria bacterium]